MIEATRCGFENASFRPVLASRECRAPLLARPRYPRFLEKRALGTRCASPHLRSCSDRLILAAIGRGESVSAMDVSDPERLEQLRANIAERLRGVCAHMPVQEFDALVLQIATVTLRYEQKPRTV
jgi:hypothetical protein